jgi:ABC-type dipeptide/oligopeptide/nickel transport system ATPase component
MTTASNPFSTRFIRPGAIGYLFPAGISAESLAQQLQQQHWRGSIIGPHGSGKSSLLTALIPALEKHERRVVHQQLQGGQRQLDWPALQPRDWTNHTLVIIDGYEQLSRWQRTLLSLRCWQRSSGLLVTAHQPVSLPLLFTTKPSLELALSIVQRILPASDDHITPSDVTEAYTRHQGNLREMLLHLYDTYRKS